MSVLSRLMRQPASAAALVILGGLALLAILAPVLAPTDPLAQNDILRTRFLAPFSTGPDAIFHLLGTDRFGRDVLTRLMYGARISLTVGLLAVGLSTLVGLLVGTTAAVTGGRVERMLMAVTDAALAMPRLVLLLVLVALFDPSLSLVVIVLAATGWMTVARLSRADVRNLMDRPFVEAARAGGLTTTRLILRHLIPNVLTPVIVTSALAVGNAIALESGLAFLGLGVPAPTPSWGNMIAGGRDALVNAPWISLAPGFAIVLVVVACNLLGDGLRDALDPTTRPAS